MATDPTGGIGQAAGEMVKELQKAQAELQQADKKPQGANPGFEQAMQAQTQAQQQSLQNQVASQASQQANLAGQTGRVVTDGAVSKVIKESNLRDKQATTVGATEKKEESKLSQMLQNLISGQDKMTKIMHMALSGKQFSPADLLAMQAGVYRFTQELDLTSKVVEKATGGIKQTLNTQV